MTISSWFAIDCNIHTHPKTLKLAGMLHLDVDAVVGKLARLWAWAKQNGVEDGNINWLPESEIADIMRWKKKPSTLITAMEDCGFLDRKDGGFSIHDWFELNGKLQSKRREDRERKRRGNSTEIPQPSEETFHGNSVEEGENFRGVSEGNPLPTIPYHTVPSLSSPMAQKERGGAKRQKRVFVKPTVEDVQAYCQERGNNVDPQLFFDHYEANGWMVGKTAMKDWKASVRTWEKQGAKPGQEAPKKAQTRIINGMEVDWYD